LAYEWMEAYCLSKTGAKKDYKEEWGWYRFLLGEKMFGALGTHKDGRPIVTLKCHPDFGAMLRENYEEIIAGYYMNKYHWNSVYLDGNVPDSVLKDMIDMSYQLIFSSLTKNMQKTILEGFVER